MAYASQCCPEGIGYAMSNRPTGPWDYKGMIMNPNNKSSGNHPGIIDYKGSSLVFGFNYTLNFALTDVHRERRSVRWQSSPTIPTAQSQRSPGGTKEGVSQVGTLNPFRPGGGGDYGMGVRTDQRSLENGVRTAQDDKIGVYVTDIQMEILSRCVAWISAIVKPRVSLQA